MIINMQSGGVVPDLIMDDTVIIPSAEDQVISVGTYLRGNLTILGDSDFIAENIKEDVNLWGITGKMKPNAGKYAWMKSSGKMGVKTTISADTSYKSDAGYANKVKIKLKSSNSDYPLSEITQDDLVGLKVQFAGSGYNSYYVLFNENGECSYWKTTESQSSATTYSWTYDQETGYINTTIGGYTDVVTSFANVTTVTVEKQETLYEYVVSNYGTDYPEDGLHTDGFYYTLLDSIGSGNPASLSNTALMTVQQDYRDTVEEEVSNANA